MIFCRDGVDRKRKRAEEYADSTDRSTDRRVESEEGRNESTRTQPPIESAADSDANATVAQEGMGVEGQGQTSGNETTQGLDNSDSMEDRSDTERDGSTL